jgi:hypothetical protein
VLSVGVSPETLGVEGSESGGALVGGGPLDAPALAPGALDDPGLPKVLGLFDEAPTPPASFDAASPPLAPDPENPPMPPTAAAAPAAAPMAGGKTLLSATQLAQACNNPMRRSITGLPLGIFGAPPSICSFARLRRLPVEAIA